MHSFKVVFICITILIFGMGSLWGAGVVPGDMNSPGEVVQARKALMMAIKINMDDVGRKLKLGQLNDIQANALAIDNVMPALFADLFHIVFNNLNTRPLDQPIIKLKPSDRKLFCPDWNFAPVKIIVQPAKHQHMMRAFTSTDF